MIATGRIYPSARIYAEQIGTNSHIIYYNGAMIREIGKEPLYTAALDTGLIRRIAVFCRERDLYLQMYHEDQIVVEKICEKTLVDPDSKVTDIVEIGDLTKAQLFPSSKMMIFDTPERLRQVRKELNQQFSEEISIP